MCVVVFVHLKEKATEFEHQVDCFKKKQSNKFNCTELNFDQSLPVWLDQWWVIATAKDSWIVFSIYSILQ